MKNVIVIELRHGSVERVYSDDVEKQVVVVDHDLDLDEELLPTHDAIDSLVSVDHVGDMDRELYRRVEASL